MDIPFNPFYVALYPEIHYTFDLFFSRLWHAQPEILADCPWRINPGCKIPLLCIIKHADRFPISLESIAVEMLYDDGTRENQTIWATPYPIKTYHWYNVFLIAPRKEYSGNILISVYINIQQGHHAHHIVNHNYRGIMKSPLKVHIAKEPLPALEHWYYGESHCHSFHSDDQVEFGAPVSATIQLATAMGLNWIAITDHSYDLDDTYGNALHYDHNLSKWKKLKKDIQNENGKNSFKTILGEEISCGSARNKNIHLLAYGINNFIPGGGDGAERWFRTRPDLPLKKVLRIVKEDGGIAYAAHPQERFTLGERFMLRRGHWEKEDHALTDYCGLQFWNGKQDKSFHEGYKRWIEMLLQGRRIYCIGGDDSHGDFNVFRQIRIPLVKMIESPYKVFGKVRTCIFCENEFNEKSILTALAKGHIIVTSGPFATLSARNEQGNTVGIGGEISGKKVDIVITGRSSEEFGDIEQVSLYTGNLKDRNEKKQEFLFKADYSNARDFEIKNTSLQTADPVYFRLEATSRKGKNAYTVYTNPIWYTPA